MAISNGMDKFMEYDLFPITSLFTRLFAQFKRLLPTPPANLRAAFLIFGSYHLDIVFFTRPFSVFKRYEKNFLKMLLNCFALESSEFKTKELISVLRKFLRPDYHQIL